MPFDERARRWRVVEDKEFPGELLRLRRFAGTCQDLNVGRRLLNHTFPDDRLERGNFSDGEVLCARINEDDHLAKRFSQQGIGIAAWMKASRATIASEPRWLSPGGSESNKPACDRLEQGAH